MFTPETREKARKTRVPRRQKMARYADTYTEQRRRFPRMALPVIAQAEQGSMPAAVKLMCLDCSGWVRAEVRDCAIPWCPLYPHRPYQKVKARNPND